MRLVLWLSLLPLVADTTSSHPLLLLISFDGFRYDLLTKERVPNIFKWSREGTAFTKGVKSQFISLTAPNHMSIVTGLHPQKHGIVSNEFYDPDLKKFYDVFNLTQTPGVVATARESEWYFGEPIWLTNEKTAASRRSASIRWPAGEATLSQAPHQPHYSIAWDDYRNLSQWKLDVDQIVSLFTNETEPINFIEWYIEEPDHTLHGEGFYTGALNKTLDNLDELFQHLLDELKKAKLDDKVNIILTADHGHAEVEGYRHVFCVKDYVDLSSPGLVHGAYMIYPADEEQGKEIFANLTRGVLDGGFTGGIQILWKKDFPSEYGWKDSKRVGEIILDFATGWNVNFNCTLAEQEATYGVKGNETFHSSMHGMRPEDDKMRALLVLNGPAFAKRREIDNIPENVDVYGLMAQVLDVTPALNDGSGQITDLALNSNSDSGGIGPVGIIIIIVLVVLILIIIAALFLRNRGIRSFSDLTVDNVKSAITGSRIHHDDANVERGQNK